MRARGGRGGIRREPEAHGTDRFLEEVAKLSKHRTALARLDLVVVVGDEDARIAAVEGNALVALLRVDLRVLFTTHIHVLDAGDGHARCRQTRGGRKVRRNSGDLSDLRGKRRALRVRPGVALEVVDTRLRNRTSADEISIDICLP